jgi:U3 small nucleolar RNA-associated protein 11
MMSKKGPSTTGKNRTGTIDGDRGNKVLSQDVVRLYKTQDLGYVRTMRNKAAKEVVDLERRVVGIRGRGQRVVFVDDEGEQVEKFMEGKDDEELDEEDDYGELKEDLQTKKLRKLKEKEAEKLESKLDTARERLKALTEAEEALELQRAKMAKSPTVGGITKAGVKFKVRERKR